MNDEEENDGGIKVILVGEAGAGKTSLINTAVGEQFFEGNQISSTTCSFVKLSKIINDREYTINLWDTNRSRKISGINKSIF